MSIQPATQLRADVRLLLAILGGTAAGIILAATIVGAGHFDSGSLGPGQDARSYWLAVHSSTPYAPQWGTFGAYVYSPAFSQLLSPVLALTWQPYLATWTFILLLTLLALTGPLLFALIVPLVIPELWGGNIHLLLALAIAAGFRWPAAWSFVLLTKVTPGVGLLWFVVRREWRSLGVALGATAVIAAGSWALAPDMWREWLDVLARSAGVDPLPGSLAVSLWVRLPIALLVVVYGGATGRRWLVPVGSMIALPALWGGALSMLVAICVLERERLEELVLTLIERLDPLRRARAERRWVSATRT